MFKKKQALKRGGKVVKKRGGGMMGPKKKMAKGGKVRGSKATEYLKKIKGSLGSKGSASLADLMPKGRDAAAKKAAGKPKRIATMMGKFKQGKGNPAGKDMSLRGKLRSMTLAKLKRKAKK
jgi:hypothetical protein